jgi:hypothetical protein
MPVGNFGGFGEFRSLWGNPWTEAGNPSPSPGSQVGPAEESTAFGRGGSADSRRGDAAGVPATAPRHQGGEGRSDDFEAAGLSGSREPPSGDQDSAERVNLPDASEDRVDRRAEATFQEGRSNGSGEGPAGRGDGQSGGSRERTAVAMRLPAGVTWRDAYISRHSGEQRMQCPSCVDGRVVPVVYGYGPALASAARG